MQIREGEPSDLPFLEEMLFEACFWNPDVARPPFASFEPEAHRFLSGWGRSGDRALIAEAEGERIGAAWFRLWTLEDHSYGFVDETLPEVAIAVTPAHRSRGVGRSLLEALIALARSGGYPGLSLSVDPANRTRRLYEAHGFRKVGESGTSWTLLLPFG